MLFSVVVMTVALMALAPTVSALQTTGSFRHEMRDSTTGWLMGSLTYSTTVKSSSTGYPYYYDVIDESYDSVNVDDLAIGHYYINIVHSVTEFTGIPNEYARGTCEFDNGFGIWTGWGWIPINQWHHTIHIWVYSSGYWTYSYA